MKTCTHVYTVMYRCMHYMHTEHACMHMFSHTQKIMQAIMNNVALLLSIQFNSKELYWDEGFSRTMLPKHQSTICTVAVMKSKKRND